MSDLEYVPVMCLVDRIDNLLDFASRQQFVDKKIIHQEGRKRSEEQQ